jgi:phage host-nuclease inhibitor protein Gam
MTDRQRIQQIEELLADLIRQGNRTEERVEMLYTELIALRDKVAAMEERNAQNFGRVRQEIQELREKIEAEIASVREELKADINSVRQELKADIADVRQELVGVRLEQAGQRVLLERILDRLDNP